MKPSTKVLGSTTGLLAVAAFSGLISGVGMRASAVPGIDNSAANVSLDAKAGVKARTLDPTTQHDCKGKNDCKGTGGCSSSDNGCKGKNSCKGKGGCNSKG
jgi:hypothetical protein